MYRELRNLGYSLGPEPSPVVAATFPDPASALSFWRKLLEEEGIYVNLMMPPATPGGEPLIRASVSAAHTPDQIRQVCKAFEDLRDVAGIRE